MVSSTTFQWLGEHSVCPFNPELLLGDFHICGSWKKDFTGKYFKHNAEVGGKVNVMVWWLEVLGSHLVVLCQATASVPTCKIRIFQLEVIYGTLEKKKKGEGGGELKFLPCFPVIKKSPYCWILLVIWRRKLPLSEIQCYVQSVWYETNFRIPVTITVMLLYFMQVFMEVSWFMSHVSQLSCWPVCSRYHPVKPYCDGT